MLVALSLAVGLAAYNSSNNILFLALSLLLSSLLLSGILAALNLSGLHFAFPARGPVRAGEATTLALGIENTKQVLPSHGLFFHVEVKRPQAETTRDKQTENLRQGPGLGPGETRELEWNWTPLARGAWALELNGVSSFFPFGFLRKHQKGSLRTQRLVWPASVPYYASPAHGSGLRFQGKTQARAGQSTDLLALRAYQPGDSLRLIHWKASARSRHLQVKRFAVETETLFEVRFDPALALWRDRERFELGLSLASTLAEDLFKEGRLRALALGAEAAQEVRGGAHLEAWLDRLALLEALPDTPPYPLSRHSCLRFSPYGPRGAAALLDGLPFAHT